MMGIPRISSAVGTQYSAMMRLLGRGLVDQAFSLDGDGELVDVPHDPAPERWHRRLYGRSHPRHDTQLASLKTGGWISLVQAFTKP